MDRATLRPEVIAFTTRLAPLTASPQANRLLLAVYPALSTAMLSRLSVANRSSLINPSCSGCRKPMARKTRSASMIFFLAGLSHLRTASVWGGNPFDFFYLNPYQVVFLSDKTVRGVRFTGGYNLPHGCCWFSVLGDTWAKVSPDSVRRVAGA